MSWLASIVLTVLTAGGIWLGLVLLAIVMTGTVGLALIIYLDSRPISRHGQFCTCVTCYQAEMAAIAPQRAAALAAATVRQAEAVVNPYLRVGDQTGQLTSCFVPRCAQTEADRAAAQQRVLDAIYRPTTESQV